MQDNFPNLREGRPDAPYFDNQIDAVMVSDGSGNPALNIVTSSPSTSGKAQLIIIPAAITGGSVTFNKPKDCIALYAVHGGFAESKVVGAAIYAGGLPAYLFPIERIVFPYTANFNAGDTTVAVNMFALSVLLPEFTYDFIKAQSIGAFNLISTLSPGEVTTSYLIAIQAID